MRAQPRRVDLGHVGKARAEPIVVGADQRIAAGQVDVIVDHHQRALREAGVDAAGGVGEDQRLDAEQPEHADREGHRPQVVPFVDVAAAGQRRDRPAPDRADDQPAFVPDRRATPASAAARRRASRPRRRACRRSRRGRSRARSRSPAPSPMRAADRIGRLLDLVVVASSPPSAWLDGDRSQQEAGDGRGHEVGERAGEHRAQAEPRQIVAAVRRQRADAADLDADRAEVGEPAQREGRDGERLRIERRPSAGRAASRRRTR